MKIGYLLVFAGLSATLGYNHEVANAAEVHSAENTVSINLDKYGPINWATVTDQHGSSVEIPISLLDKIEDQLGLRFHGKTDKSQVYFSTVTESRLGFPGHNPRSDMDLKRSDCDGWPPEYETVKANVAAFSCKSGNIIKYYIARYNSSGNSSLYIEYPLEKSDLWASIVKRMSASIHQAVRTEK